MLKKGPETIGHVRTNSQDAEAVAVGEGEMGVPLGHLLPETPHPEAVLPHVDVMEEHHGSVT